MLFHQSVLKVWWLKAFSILKKEQVEKFERAHVKSSREQSHATTVYLRARTQFCAKVKENRKKILFFLFLSLPLHGIFMVLGCRDVY